MDNNYDPKQTYYCQQERTEELNRRILDRLNPNRLMQSQFDIRSVPTRYIRMPMIDSVNPSQTPIIRVPDYSVSKDFNPGNDKSPYAGYANDIDRESNLKNLFYPKQRCAQAYHIPNTTSDLYEYNFSVNEEDVNQPHPRLFTEENFSPFNPNRCNLGGNRIYNHTRQQVKNLSMPWLKYSRTFGKETQEASAIYERSMNSCVNMDDRNNAKNKTKENIVE
jgi:hypothetical protein